MIYDVFENLEQYVPLLPRLAKAIPFITKTDFASIQDGRVEIDGDDVFANVQTYDTKSIDMLNFEAHRRYADIQFVVSGDGELCGIAVPTMDQTPVKPYDQDKDVLFVAPAVSDWFRLVPGYFALFLPQDAHEPGRQFGNVAKVRKCVVKVRI